jgi:hypothetical protein
MTGLELIGAVRAWLRRYVHVSPAQELVIALWCLHTWVYDRLGRTTPYIEMTGVSGSGKTTIMEAMALLSRGSVILTTLRTLAMCRKIHETEGRVTFFVDEAERLSSSSFGDQRSMLASGYRRGGEHMVSVGKETQMFPVWCPKVFTSLRTLTPVIHNRCIPLWVERGTPAASLSNEWERAEATAAEVIEQYRNVMRAVPRVIAVDPLWLSNERDREIWTPLFSLAATLGADKATMDELTAASVDLSSLRGVERRMDAIVEDEAARERSYAVRLLQDCKAVILPGEAFIPTAVLVDRLRALPTGPWRSYQRSGLTDITLAQLLGAFAVGSVIGQEGKGAKNRKVVRGYRVAHIRDAKF